MWESVGSVGSPTIFSFSHEILRCIFLCKRQMQKVYKSIAESRRREEDDQEGLRELVGYLHTYVHMSKMSPNIVRGLDVALTPSLLCSGSDGRSNDQMANKVFYLMLGRNSGRKHARFRYVRGVAQNCIVQPRDLELHVCQRVQKSIAESLQIYCGELSYVTSADDTQRNQRKKMAEKMGEHMQIKR